MTQIQWSIHRDGAKIGTVEDIKDPHLADRYVSTGMATFVVDEPEVTEAEPVPAESILTHSAAETSDPVPTPPTPVVADPIVEHKAAETKVKAPAKSQAKAPTASE